MGHQIIKQPDGLYAVFSSGTDTWVKSGTTRQEIIEWYAERAERDAREKYTELLDQIDAAQDVREVYPFGETFEEANAMSAAHGGEDLDEKMTDAGQVRQALNRYDSDEAFRARILALYRDDRTRFFFQVLSLALSEGYGRREAVEFAKTVAVRVREEAARTDG